MTCLPPASSRRSLPEPAGRRPGSPRWTSDAPFDLLDEAHIVDAQVSAGFVSGLHIDLAEDSDGQLTRPVLGNLD